MRRKLKAHRERGLHRLFYTGSGDLDLSWFLVLMFALTAITGFLVETFTTMGPTVWAWSFLGGAFLTVMIAAVPIAKARLIANSRSIGDFSGSIASGGGNVFNDDERDPNWDKDRKEAQT